METTATKKQIIEKAHSLKTMETENLINILTRYNENMMAQCERYNSENCQSVIEDILKQTYEIETVMEMLKNRLKEIQDFIYEDLPNIEKSI